MPRLTEEQTQWVISNYCNGRTMPDISRELGVTKMGISKLLRRYGVKTRGARTPPASALPLIPPPPQLQLSYMPPVHGVIDHLAVIVMDPVEWSVHQIMARYDVSHAHAVRWFLRQSLHLRLNGYAAMFLWKNEVSSSALRNMLLHKSGQATDKRNARDGRVVEVSQADADAFYRLHHLQGSCHSQLSYGLQFDGVLMACMSFNTASICRGVEGHHLLQRFASAGSVRGAASRLLAAFRRANPGPIVSYSDQRYAPGGNLYRVLGFTLEHQRGPDYRYWKDDRWFAKNQKQRRHLLAEGGVGETEFEMAHQLGYHRCYDLGKFTWILASGAGSSPSLSVPRAADEP